MRKFLTTSYIKNGYISATKKSINANVSAHWHEFYEIEYFISGSGTCNLDGVEYPITDGLLLFMTPTSFHSIETTDATILNVMFTENICDISLLSTLATHAPLVVDTDMNIKNYLTTLIMELISQKQNLKYASTLMNAILAKLTICSTTSDTIERSSVIRNLEFYILNNFRNPLSLEDAAKHLNLSPTYVSYLFKKETGKNFKTYLNELRFDYAKKLLIFSDMTVMQICSACGFEDYPNFIRRFEKKFGVYPVQFRKTHRI